MWQITYILSFLPDWFWTLVLIAGVIGILVSWVLKFVPFVNTYKLPLQVASVLFLLIGVYFQGVINNEKKYEAEHKRLQEEIKKINEESKKLNEDLIKTQAERDVAISQRGKTIIERIEKYVTGNPVEIVKEFHTKENLSEAERQKLEAEIRALQEAEKKCPVPSLYIKELNEAATNPPKEKDKK